MSSSINAAIQDVSTHQAELVKQSGSIMDKISNARRFAIGKNAETLALHQYMRIEAVIDDGSSPGQSWNDIPLVRMDCVPQSAWVINCSSSISPVLVQKQLEIFGFSHVTYATISDLSKGALKSAKFVDDSRVDISKNLQQWQKILDQLADEESRIQFLDIIKYRLSGDLNSMKKYQVRIQEQYFEKFMNYQDEVFVDAGGFDGDTTEGFIKRYSYKKILFFEPSTQNMAKAKKRLGKYCNIDYYAVGLSDGSAMLPFNAAEGSASVISDEGRDTIQVRRLDDIAHEPLTFIKMDLEGWELKALEGARETITQFRPKLALAVYHDPSHFRKIFDFVSNLNLNYEVYFRHYTQGWSESIMYFK